MASIVFLPMFNSYGLVDNILCAEGDSFRSFRGIHELRTALYLAGAESLESEAGLQLLCSGLICEIALTEAAKQSFYSESY